MRIYNVFHPEPLEPRSCIVLSEEESRHLGAVKRVRRGFLITVLNGAGQRARAIVQNPNRKAMEVRLEDVRTEPPPARRRVLCCAFTKSTHFDEMLQRSVELGMTEFWPLYTERTVVELDEQRFRKKQDRWLRIGIEAIKQCERGWLPKFEEPADITTTLRLCREEGLLPVLLTARDQGIPTLTQWLRKERDRDLLILLGPEGGWEESEVAEMREAGAQSVSLTAASVLRTETAALASLGIIASLDGEGAE